MLDVGWRGAERIRRLTLRYQDRRLHCDFLDSLISDYGPQGLYKHHPVESSRPLEAAFRAFLNAIASPASNGFPDARVASRIVDLAVKTRPARRSGRPRIAVIGGGVFGATAAIEAAGLGDVTLYERHDELMTEASFGNQWRQHSGFHYPRSYDTVHEIQETKAAFEESYRDIVLPVDSYYATAARGETITKDRYFDMCRGMGLTFSVDRPPPEYLAHDQVTACLKSDESVLDFEAMRRLIRRRIEASNSIDLQLGAEVVGGELRSDGTKTLIVDRRGQRTRPAFDYVINAAYANTNLLASWMGLPLRRLRFDFCEMVVVEIDMPPISMTVLDGPFTSVVATGRDNLFILSQAEQSVLWSQTPSDGLPPKLDRPVSNRENLLRHGKRYFPVLDQARFVESRYGLRTVVAHNQDYDGRPTVVTRHGFGCWSVLGGKILTCVANVREIANEIVAAERA